MDHEQFQELILASLERLSRDNMEIRQNSNELNQRIEVLASTVARIENDLAEKLSAVINALEAQLEVGQRILDALARDEKQEEPSSKGLFS
jgi:hypothetical protein